MKTNFKKLALAAATTAAVAGSMNASAVIQGVPGEANLSTFVYYNIPTVVAGVSGPDLSLGLIDTIFRVTVPVSIGYDVVTQFTAPNTVPTPPAGASESQDVQAGLAAGGNNSAVHWFFMSATSTHIQNGTIPVTADDAVMVSLRGAMNSSATYDNTPGYMIWTTEAARLGTADANFAFFVDTYMTFGGQNGNPSVVNIPTLPMADSIDTAAAPTQTNNVVEATQYVGNDPDASPIISGIRTSTGTAAYNLRVYDITLASRADDELATLIVSWNDRNLGQAAGVMAGADEYDEDENACSTTVSLPNELNLIYVPDYTLNTAQQSGNPNQVGPIALAPNLLGVNAVQNTLCSAFGDHANATAAGSGFVKLYHQNPTGALASATFAYSIPFIEGAANNTFDVYSATWLSHDRGNFTSR